MAERPAWRRLISDVCNKIDNDRRNNNRTKRAKRRERRTVERR